MGRSTTPNLRHPERRRTCDLRCPLQMLAPVRRYAVEHVVEPVSAGVDAVQGIRALAGSGVRLVRQYVGSLLEFVE